MTVTSQTRVGDVVGQPYRAKDITMSATIDVEHRTVFLTGAIDTNSHDILGSSELRV